MSNGYFDPPTPLAPSTRARAEDVNFRFDSVARGFDKLPAPFVDGYGKKSFSEPLSAPDAISIVDLPTVRQILSGEITTGVATGSGNYMLVLPIAPVAYGSGMVVWFRVISGNTGEVTLNINGLGAKAMVNQAGSPLVSGDIVAGQTVGAAYDGTRFSCIAFLPGQQAAIDSAATRVAADKLAAGNSATLASQKATEANQSKVDTAAIAVLVAADKVSSGNSATLAGQERAATTQLKADVVALKNAVALDKTAADNAATLAAQETAAITVLKNTVVNSAAQVAIDKAATTSSASGASSSAASALTSKNESAASAVIAGEKATIATNKTAEVVTAGNNAISSITTAGNTQVTRVNNTGDPQITRVVNETNAQLLRVSGAGDTQVTRLATEGDTQTTKVTTAGTTQVARVKSDGGDVQLSRVTTEGKTQVTRVTDTGTTQVGLATTQAGIASTKAGEAASSAASALASKNSAATSETNAGTSATSASNSATSASTSATSALGSAETATTQAGIASTKAGEITTVGDGQVARVTTEGNTQTNRVIAEGNTQEARLSTFAPDASYARQTSGTGSLRVPVGTSAERVFPGVVGYLRYNTTLGYFEKWNTVLGYEELGGGGGNVGYSLPPIDTTIKKASFMCSKNTVYILDVGSTASGFTAQLPTAAIGDFVQIIDYKGTCSPTKPITVTYPSKKLEGRGGSLILTQKNINVVFQYFDNTVGWVRVNGFNPNAVYTATDLVDWPAGFLPSDLPKISGLPDTVLNMFNAAKIVSQDTEPTPGSLDEGQIVGCTTTGSVFFGLHTGMYKIAGVYTPFAYVQAKHDIAPNENTILNSIEYIGQKYYPRTSSTGIRIKVWIASFTPGAQITCLASNPPISWWQLVDTPSQTKTITSTGWMEFELPTVSIVKGQENSIGIVNVNAATHTIRIGYTNTGEYTDGGFFDQDIESGNRGDYGNRLLTFIVEDL